MSATAIDPSHLVALIGAAKAHADTLGTGTEEIGRLLDEAMTGARALAARDGRADEGLRLDQLTTDNDEGVS